MSTEPAGAAVLSGRPAGPHQIPGIGVGFVPAVLNRAILDEIAAVISDEDAFACARRLAREEGILADLRLKRGCFWLRSRLYFWYENGGVDTRRCLPTD
jgi:cysteine synthase A